MTIQQLNANNSRYIAQRHACSSLYFISTKADGWIIDSAMSLTNAIAWMKANQTNGMEG